MHDDSGGITARCAQGVAGGMDRPVRATLSFTWITPLLGRQLVVT